MFYCVICCNFLLETWWTFSLSLVTVFEYADLFNKHFPSCFHTHLNVLYSLSRTELNITIDLLTNELQDLDPPHDSKGARGL